MVIFKEKNWIRDALFAAILILLIKNLMVETTENKAGIKQDAEAVAHTKTLEEKETKFKENVVAVNTQITKAKECIESCPLEKRENILITLNQLTKQIEELAKKIERSEKKANLAIVLGPLASASKTLDDINFEKELTQIATKLGHVLHELKPNINENKNLDVAVKENDDLLKDEVAHNYF
ncbi:MAG: hypothetical protein UR26_C0004G0023 [candidate division TM6 bacterium GW2011_GWF2_32_72]|nr:MAG: hypothetical protein UR26_C0004G0023 [candidate division TM6 bacterium GW2011_GWF2_32_72]